MIRRNPEYARAREMRALAGRAALSPSDLGRVGSTPAHTQLVGGNDPDTGAVVLYGILGVTPASEDFRLKD
jgi:hypothetical protein